MGRYRGLAAGLLLIIAGVLVLAGCTANQAVPMPTPIALGPRFADSRPPDDPSLMALATATAHAATATTVAAEATAIGPTLTAIATVKPPPATATAIVATATALASAVPAARATSTAISVKLPRAAPAVASGAAPIGTPYPMAPGQILAPDCDAPLSGTIDSITCQVPTPVPTLTPDPTATTAPSMTALPTSTTVPTLVPTATPAPPLIEGMPICPHNTQLWHGLVERNPDGSVACTYGHTHYDDPKTLDAAFGGPDSAWWGGNQELSYPWQTFSAAGQENVVKHSAYKIETIDDPSCKGNPAGGLSYDKIRVQAHLDGNAGATTRYHSFAMELRTCDPANLGAHGFIRTGGWLDYGYLEVRNTPNTACPPGKLCPNGQQFYVVPLPNDPAIYQMGAARRGHGSPLAGRAGGTWYGNSGTLLANPLGSIREDWGPVDPNSPGIPPLFYPSPTDGCSDPCNGSFNEPVHLLGSTVAGFLDCADGSCDGVANLNTSTDRYGKIVSGCTAAGLDCVPLQLTNVKVGSYNFRSGATTEGGAFPIREYDVKSPVTGRSLIQYPN